MVQRWCSGAVVVQWCSCGADVVQPDVVQMWCRCGADVVQCCSGGAVVQWCSGAVVQMWCIGALVQGHQLFSVAVVPFFQWYQLFSVAVAVVQWCSGAGAPAVYRICRKISPPLG